MKTKFNIKLSNRVMYSLIAFFIMLAGAGIIYAQSTTPNPGHDATQVGPGNFQAGTYVFQPNSLVEVKTGDFTYGLMHTSGPVTLGTYIATAASPSTLNGGWIGTKTNHPLHFFTNNQNPQMTLSTGGNLGIGTIPGTLSPKLTVFQASTTAPGVQITQVGAGDGLWVGTTTGYGILSTAPKNHFVGDIKIGGTFTTPLASLDISEGDAIILPVSSSPPLSCNSANAGAMYYDSTVSIQQTLRQPCFCNGNGWVGVVNANNCD